MSMSDTGSGKNGPLSVPQPSDTKSDRSQTEKSSDGKSVASKSQQQNNDGTYRRTGSFARQSRAGDARKDVTSTELANYHRLFTTFDVDNSGYLEFSELQFLLRCLGIFLDDETMETLREEFDEDGNDLLDFDEFVNLMHRTGELSSLRVVSEEDERKHIMNVVSKRFTAESMWRWVWDTLILLITGYFVIRVPLDFHKVVEYDPVTITMEIVFTIVMFIDMGIYGNTAFQDQAGKNIENLNQVAWRYFTTFFGFDLLGALPLDMLAYAADSSGYTDSMAFIILRGFRLFRCVRVAKTLYLNTSITGLLTPEFVYFSYHVTPVLRSLFFLAFAMHLLTIGWLIVRDDPSQTYVQSLYLVLFTVTTVGYGDILIDKDGERLYCCFLFMCGVLVNGIVISQMSVFMQKADIESERNDKMRETLAVLRHFNIPGNIQSEILSFQNHLLEHNLGSSHASLISSLPVSIQESLALFMKIKYISMVPMFEIANHDCKIALAQCLINIVFRPQEFIIIAGETGKEMYFLGHGIADVIHPKGNYLATLRKGNFFGEIALIVEEAHRTASIKALTYCDVFRLEKRDFSTILKKFPAFRDSVKEQMEERVKQFQASGNANIIPQRKRKEAEDAPKPEAQERRQATHFQGSNSSPTVAVSNDIQKMVAEASKAATAPHNPRKSTRSGRFQSSAASQSSMSSMQEDSESDLPMMTPTLRDRAKATAAAMFPPPSTGHLGASLGGSWTGVPGAVPNDPRRLSNYNMTGSGPIQQVVSVPSFGHPGSDGSFGVANTRRSMAPSQVAQPQQEYRALVDRMSRIENYLLEQAETASDGDLIRRESLVVRDLGLPPVSVPSPTNAPMNNAMEVAAAASAADGPGQAGSPIIVMSQNGASKQLYSPASRDRAPSASNSQSPRTPRKSTTPRSPQAMEGTLVPYQPPPTVGDDNKTTVETPPAAPSSNGATPAEGSGNTTTAASSEDSAGQQQQ